jgi:hypothetical protein
MTIVVIIMLVMGFVWFTFFLHRLNYNLLTVMKIVYSIKTGLSFEQSDRIINKAAKGQE